MDWLHYVEMGFITLIIAYLAISRGDNFAHEMWVKYVDLDKRTDKLEKETKYIADQPKGIADTPFAWELARNAYASGVNLLEVPITDVVKAIVKHLGMEIEKVDEKTVKTPQEVKVVEKKPSITITGVEGTTGTTWANPCPPPVAKKRGRPAKRKTK